MRVLVAEDEPRVAAALVRGLRREGMAVDVAADGANALRKARATPYDVVVLDRDLPELHGDDVCRELTAQRPATKVLMLTAARSTDSLVEGFALGADDYLPKPFRFAELVARLRALGRRRGEALPPVLRAGEPVDLVGQGAARGQHQHPRCRARADDLGAQPIARHPGQVAVEHHHVVSGDRRLLVPGLAVVRDVDGHPLAAQATGDGVGQRTLVLDHQHPHQRACSSGPKSRISRASKRSSPRVSSRRGRRPATTPTRVPGSAAAHSVTRRATS